MRTVIVTGTRAPSGLYAARLFHLAGWRVFALESCAFPLSRADRARYDTLACPSPVKEPEAFAACLHRLLKHTSADLIFPACEEVFHLSKALEGTGSEDLLFAPGRDALFGAHSKAVFPDMLRHAGLEAPETLCIRRGMDVAGVEARLGSSVLKPEYSRFAVHTILHPDPAHLRIIASQDTSWICQERLEGQEICVHAMAVRGEVTAMALYAPRHRAGPSAGARSRSYASPRDRLKSDLRSRLRIGVKAGRAAQRGAGVYFDPVLSPDTEDYLRRFVASTGWTGQIGLDVILTRDRGPVAIECNPRATSGIHFFSDPGSFAEATMGRAAARVRRTPLMISPAMFGAPLVCAIRKGAFAAWLDDIRRATDALALGALSAPKGTMARAAVGFCASALRSGRSVLDETTVDIAWGGEPRPGKTCNGSEKA